MIFCNNCGAENPDKSAYCSGCGSRIKIENVNKQGQDLKVDFNNITPQKNPTIYALPPKRSGFYKGLAIVIVALLIIAGIGYYVAENYGHQADVAFYVHSTHVTEDVDIIVYIDGKEVFSSQDLSPGQVVQNKYYYAYNFSLFEDAKLITVKAISTSGGLGVQTDSESIIVHNGQKYSVDLYV